MKMENETFTTHIKIIFILWYNMNMYAETVKGIIINTQNSLNEVF